MTDQKRAPTKTPPQGELRVRALVNPVTITLDGEAIVAERGEPLAVALVGAGKHAIARSPKFHRPRGPACMRAACDGCLARVDDEPNVMTCLTPAADGSRVVTQNRLGPRQADLLRMTDWFFPDGMNHHELFAGVPGVQTVMQAFARRVAGLGKLPEGAPPIRAAARRPLDVVIVGAGPSGMALATALARRGRKVEVIDDQLAAGGSARALVGDDRFASLFAAFEGAVASGAVRLRLRTTAGGLFGKDLLVHGPDGAEILEGRAIALACGAHDGTLAFEGNDLPAVMSARAAGICLSWGVVVGKKIVVIVDGGGPFGEAFAAAARNIPGVSVEVVVGTPITVHGASLPKAVTVQRPDGTDADFACDAVVLDAARSPAYELCEQAGGLVTGDHVTSGVKIVHEARGFVVDAPNGVVARGIFAVGEICGVAFEPTAIVENAERTAETIARET